MTTTTPEATTQARDCHVYACREPGAREVREMGRWHANGARAKAMELSGHRVKALRPFYAAVYDGEHAYPVAVYQDGEELGDEAAADVLTVPLTAVRRYVES